MFFFLKIFIIIILTIKKIIKLELIYILYVKTNMIDILTIVIYLLSSHHAKIIFCKFITYYLKFSFTCFNRKINSVTNPDHF